MDILTYALCESIASSAASGVAGAEVSGTDLIITMKDGKVLTMNFPIPKDGQDGKDGINGIDGINGVNGKDGISLDSIYTVIDEDGSTHIICVLSNGDTIDAGKINYNFATPEDIDALFAEDSS